MTVQCPWSLEQFGGHETYSTPAGTMGPQTDKPGRCWPGMRPPAYLVCFSVLRDRRPRLAKQAFILPCLGFGVLDQPDDAGCALLSHTTWTAIFSLADLLRVSLGAVSPGGEG